MEKVRAIFRNENTDMYLSCDLPDISIPKILDLNKINQRKTNDNIFSFQYWTILLDLNSIDKDNSYTYCPAYINNSNTVVILDEIKIKSTDTTEEAQLKINNINLFKATS